MTWSRASSLSNQIETGMPLRRAPPPPPTISPPPPRPTAHVPRLSIVAKSRLLLGLITRSGVGSRDCRSGLNTTMGSHFGQAGLLGLGVGIRSRYQNKDDNLWNYLFLSNIKHVLWFSLVYQILHQSFTGKEVEIHI